MVRAFCCLAVTILHPSATSSAGAKLQPWAKSLRVRLSKSLTCNGCHWTLYRNTAKQTCTIVLNDVSKQRPSLFTRPGHVLHPTTPALKPSNATPELRTQGQVDGQLLALSQRTLKDIAWNNRFWNLEGAPIVPKTIFSHNEGKLLTSEPLLIKTRGICVGTLVHQTDRQKVRSRKRAVERKLV